MDIQEEIIATNITEVVNKVTKFFSGSVLNDKIVEKSGKIVTVVLLFNYPNDENYSLVPYARFILLGFEKIYYDSNVYSKNSNVPTIESTKEHAKGRFKHYLSLV